MAATATTEAEPFPPLSRESSRNRKDLGHDEKYKGGVSSGSESIRRRRKSSGLGGELRGDTGAPAVSTLNSQTPLSPLTPSSVSCTLNAES